MYFANCKRTPEQIDRKEITGFAKGIVEVV